MRCITGLIFTTLALALATPTLALDFTQPVLDEEGKVVCTDPNPAQVECPVDKVLTLDLAVRRALNATYVDEQNLSGEEKFKRSELAHSVRGAKDLTLKAEDIAIIKKITGKAYGPPLVRAVWLLLDPALRSAK